MCSIVNLVTKKPDANQGESRCLKVSVTTWKYLTAKVPQGKVLKLNLPRSARRCKMEI